MTAPLITRLEEAAEGSRELDELVALGTTHPYGIGPSGRAVMPYYTTSLDAALALAERVLPGWAWEIRIDAAGTSVEAAPRWWLEGLAAPDEDGVAVEGKTSALALCIAIAFATNQEQPNV
jgi:hypothetical protein